MRIALLTILLLLGLSAAALARDCCGCGCCCWDDGGRGAALFPDATKLFGYDGKYKGRWHPMPGKPEMHEMGDGPTMHGPYETEGAPTGHGTSAPALTSLDSTPVAYLDGDFSSDFEQQFMRMVELAMGQGLLGEHTHVWGIAPDVIGGGYGPQAKHWAAVTLAPGMAPSGELQAYTIPAGEYLMMQHIGAYEGLEASWTAFFEWAYANGVELDPAKPALTHFVSDPETTPEAELISEMYLPVL